MSRALHCPKCGDIDLEVTQLKSRHFALYSKPSNYSEVRCRWPSCRCTWRTRSNAVHRLPRALTRPRGAS